MSSPNLPPGTHLVGDLINARLVLAPQPNEDPNQPLNWPTWRKTLQMILLSLYGLMVFAILCASQPLWSVWNAELGISYATLNNGYAGNTATLAVGCIFLVPLAMRYGRRPLYLVTCFSLLGIAIWQALFTTGTEYLVMSVLCGIPSALNEALFQVSISELFFVHQRGTMNGIFLIATTAGVNLSPVAAGYIAASHNWRWVFWICTIIGGTLFVVMLFAFEETKYFAPVLDGRAIQAEADSADNSVTRVTSVVKDSKDLIGEPGHRIPSATGDRGERRVPISTSIPMNSYWKRLSLWTWDHSTEHGQHERSIFRHSYYPFACLITFPAVMLTAIIYGFTMAVGSILSITSTTLYPFPPYNFSTIGVGNMNVAPMIGILLGTLYGGPFVDWSILKIAARRKGIYEPETRLWLSIFPALVSTAGILTYGLTIAKGMPWPINAVGAGLTTFGTASQGNIVLTYCQDSYQNILGDAFTGVVFVRNLITTILVFAIAPWMENMGVYNMFVLLACLNVGISSLCIPFFIWGRKWRSLLASKYEFYAAQQF